MAPTSAAQTIPRAESGASVGAGDSIYWFGRSSLARGDYASAARALGELRVRFPAHQRAGAAQYWRAVALRGVGTQRSRMEAFGVLDDQRRNYPRSKGRDDSALLEIQLCGETDFNGGSPIGQRCAALLDAAVAKPCTVSQQARARAAAISAIVRRRDPRSLTVVREFISPVSGCPAELRRQVLLLALELESVGGNAIVILASRDPDPIVQLRAVRLLAEIPVEGSVQRLTEIASGADSRLRRQALSALAQNTAPGARKAVREMIVVPSEPAVQLPAIEALADNLRGQADVEFLITQFGSISETGRRQVLRSLGERHDARIRAWILGVASDTAVSRVTRAQAVRALAQDDEGMNALITYYDTRHGRLLGAELLRVFASEGGDSGIAKLQDIRLSDPDPALRALAARLLRHETDKDSP